MHKRHAATVVVLALAFVPFVANGATAGTVTPAMRPAGGYQTVPSPSFPDESRLSGVDCINIHNCYAVGGRMLANNGSPALIEHWDGASWTEQTVSLVNGVTGVLNSVSCPSARFCMAAGDFAAGRTLQAVYAIFDGSTWTETTAPVPPVIPGQNDVGFSFFNSVSCTSKNNCWAVGEHQQPTAAVAGSLTFIQHWDGARWTIVTSPDPGDESARGSFADLTGVSCASARSCEAVGTMGNTSSQITNAFAEHWDGTSWTLQTVPAPPAGYIARALNGVSCVSARACEAVGDVATAGDQTTTKLSAWALAWDGYAWHAQSVPNLVDGTLNHLLGVSCVTASNCDAVGAGDGANDQRGVLRQEYTQAAHWNGHKWSLVPTWNTKSDDLDDLDAVSCVPHGCVAVGTNGVVTQLADSIAVHFQPIIETR